MDAFLEEARVFRNAWSTGTSTLPAHASMFSGLFPHQAGISSLSQRLPTEVETIAELLAEHGYRTGAITDSVVVSTASGLAQGFGFFDEARRTIESTLERARAFLDADDGRPLFLFVHTYRAHSPYRVSAETRRERGTDLELGRPYDVLMEELRRSGSDIKEPDLDDPAVRDATRALHDVYRGGAVDVDRAFGVFLNDLKRHGLHESAFVVLASDHGEAFGEHGRLFHTAAVHEEQLRVPLGVAGPGIEAGIVDYPASLVDLAPTLAAMAGLAPEEHWMGTSLLDLATERPLFAFQSVGREDSTLGILDGSRKLITRESGAALGAELPFAAYDLAQDPGERANLAEAEDWPAAMLRRLGPAAESLLVPLVGAQGARLDAERLDELRAMGYAGEAQ